MKLSKKFTVGLTIACTSAFTLGVLAGGLTLSWYIQHNRSTMGMNANVHGSYFESGDGSAELPFEIHREVQLYYLSWLQQMGYFNQADTDPETGEVIMEDGHPVIKQYHFRISANLNMESYVLPPVGTQEYPFVGSLDGHNYTISNLTVSNNKNGLTDDPDKNAEYNFEIVGLFGVVGSLDGPESNSAGGLGENEDGEYVHVDGYRYDTSATYIQNLYINGATISTQTSNSLVGVVAGYVNAPISNVGVNSSKLSIGANINPLLNGPTTNLSDYHIVGYATDPYKEQVKIVNTNVYQPTAEASTFVTISQGNTWGGSIDMKTLLNRIMKVRAFTGTVTDNNMPAYTKTETAVRQANGNIINRTQTSTSTAPATAVNGTITNNKTVYYNANDDRGNYYFCSMGDNDSDNNIYGNTKRPKAYILGNSDVPSSSSKLVTYTNLSNETETAYYFKHNSNYYYVNNGNLQETSSASNGTKWHYNSTTHYLSCLIVANGQYSVYFLNCNSDGQLYASTTPATAWSNNGGNFSYAYGNISTFKIKSNNHYFNIDNNHTGFRDETNENNATVYSFENYGSSTHGQIYTTINNVNYYLTSDYDGSYTHTPKFVTNNNGNYREWYRENNNNTNTYLSQQQNNGFLFYDSTRWRCGWSSKQRVDLIPVAEGSGTTLTLSKENTTDTKFNVTEEYERSGLSGYIPLAVNGNKTKFNAKGSVTADDLATSPKNTGYIVGGFYDQTNGGTATDDNTYRGDVRVSAYNIDELDGSYDKNQHKFTSLYTIKNGVKTEIDLTHYRDGTNKNTLEYKKLTDSLSNLENDINGAASVYGIHFMDSVISKEHTIRASKVLINKETYTDYEMPEDSVDFNLKDKGYINFFAGNYHNDNNSFFTLSKIERVSNDPTSIDTIKKIRYVFGSTDSSQEYIYKYSDGTYSDGGSYGNVTQFNKTVGSSSVTYSVIFDTNDIGKNTGAITTGKNGGNQAWYYEIPVNAGEYALGSVENACGGYLIYLDISAASQTIHRQELSEIWTTSEETYEHPLGVGYVTAPGSDENPINDRDTATLGLNGNATGDYTVTRNGDTINTGSNTTGASVGFVGDGITTTPLEKEGASTEITRRITDYDFNEITGVYVKQIMTIRSKNNHNVVSISFAINELEPANVNDYDLIATYEFEFDGTEPFYSYSYYYHDTDKVLELIFQTDTAFDVTVDSLESGYGITSDSGETIYRTYTEGMTCAVAVSADVTTDSWASVPTSETPTSLRYVYSSKDTLTVDYNFTFSGLVEASGDGTGERQVKSITIQNGMYTITVTVTSGTEPVTVYTSNEGNNSIVGGSGTATVTITSETSSSPAIITIEEIGHMTAHEETCVPFKEKNGKTVD